MRMREKARKNCSRKSASATASCSTRITSQIRISLWRQRSIRWFESARKTHRTFFGYVVARCVRGGYYTIECVVLNERQENENERSRRDWYCLCGLKCVAFCRQRRAFEAAVAHYTINLIAFISMINAISRPETTAAANPSDVPPVRTHTHTHHMHFRPFFKHMHTLQSCAHVIDCEQNSVQCECDAYCACTVLVIRSTDRRTHLNFSSRPFAILRCKPCGCIRPHEMNNEKGTKPVKTKCWAKTEEKRWDECDEKKKKKKK